MNQKILITGAAGFIGFHLSKSLLADGFEVLGIDNLNDYYDQSLKKARLKILEEQPSFKFDKIDIYEKNELEKSFKKFQPNMVVNLAAQAGVRYSIENPYEYINSNIVGFTNIIELCRHNDVKGLIYASSSSVYGGNTKIPFDVKDRVDNPVSLYAATKKANELIANSYSHLYGLHTTGLRFFTVYGPWGRPDMAMFMFLKNILEGKPINVFNNGDMKRDFTYIDDIIEGIKAAIKKNYACEIFNIGNSISEKLMDMIQVVENEADKKARINFLPMQPGDVRESFADIEYSTRKLGYKPTTSISQGIPNFVKWYRKYHEK
jgi:UDP-glucuronate 4-epimerase